MAFLRPRRSLSLNEHPNINFSTKRLNKVQLQLCFMFNKEKSSLTEMTGIIAFLNGALGINEI